MDWQHFIARLEHNNIRHSLGGGGIEELKSEMRVCRSCFGRCERTRFGADFVDYRLALGQLAGLETGWELQSFSDQSQGGFGRKPDKCDDRTARCAGVVKHNGL